VIEKPLLACLLCSKKYSIVDIRNGRYFPETGICIMCYRRMAKDDGTCFAKQYDASAIECHEFCPDRRVCKEWKDG
jgi:hypothetical protein